MQQMNLALVTAVTLLSTIVMVGCADSSSWDKKNVLSSQTNESQASWEFVDQSANLAPSCEESETPFDCEEGGSLLLVPEVEDENLLSESEAKQRDFIVHVISGLFEEISAYNISFAVSPEEFFSHREVREKLKQKDMDNIKQLIGAARDITELLQNFHLARGLSLEEHIPQSENVKTWCDEYLYYINHKLKLGIEI